MGEEDSKKGVGEGVLPVHLDPEGMVVMVQGALKGEVHQGEAQVGIPEDQVLEVLIPVQVWDREGQGDHFRVLQADSRDHQWDRDGSDHHVK